MDNVFLYKPAIRLDMLGKKHKMINKLNAFALIAIILCSGIGAILNYCLRMPGEPGGLYFVYFLCGAFNCLMYIYLHELVHALAIILIKRRRPEIHFGRFVASCGAPAEYFSKAQYFFVASAPFIFFSILLIPLCVLLPPVYFALPFMPMCYNLFGSIGDMYMIHKMMKSPKDSIIVDAGTAVTSYAPVYDNVDAGI